MVLGVGLYIGYRLVHGRAESARAESRLYFTLPFVAVLLAAFAGGYRGLLRRRSLTIDPDGGRWVLKTGVFPFFCRREGGIAEIGGIVLRRDEIERNDTSYPIFALEIEWRQPGPEPFRVQEFDLEVWRSGSFQLQRHGESCLPAARARAMEIARLTGLLLHDEIAYEEVRPAQPPDTQSAASAVDATPNVAADDRVIPYESAEDAPAPDVEMAVPGASVLRLLRMWFMGYAGTAFFVAMPVFGPRFVNSDHPPIDWHSGIGIAVVAFSIVTLVLICRHVPMAAGTLICVGNGRFCGHRRWLLVKFRKREYPLKFLRRVRLEGERIEVEFGPPPETSICPTARPVPIQR
ncbi:MAG: hypothetical protein ACHRHE_08925 [Tepidisphaerales bacterium]